MDFALHTTSAKALAYRSPVEAVDTDWLVDVSFTDLLEMRDAASEEGDWRGCDELDVELRARRAEATGKLMKRFADAVEGRAFILVITGGVITAASTREYLTDVLGTNAGTEMAVRMVLGQRAEVIAQLAAEYASENVEELLRAGLDVEGL